MRIYTLPYIRDVQNKDAEGNRISRLRNRRVLANNRIGRLRARSLAEGREDVPFNSLRAWASWARIDSERRRWLTLTLGHQSSLAQERSPLSFALVHLLNLFFLVHVLLVLFLFVSALLRPQRGRSIGQPWILMIVTSFLSSMFSVAVGHWILICRPVSMHAFFRRTSPSRLDLRDVTRATQLQFADLRVIVEHSNSRASTKNRRLKLCSPIKIDFF